MKVTTGLTAASVTLISEVSATLRRASAPNAHVPVASAGIAAFGVGPLQDAAGISLSTLYGATAVVAVVMGVIAFIVVPRQPLELAGAPVGAR